MPVGKSFFDQYSVICVLGSVVGCVVVPLITQSVESLILSAILISITAKTLSSKIVPSANDLRVSTLPPPSPLRPEDRRRPRDKDPLVEKKVKKKKLLAAPSQPPSQAVLDPDELLQREDELRKHEEERVLEKERRLEEKREKKARKREERLKRKEEERKEKEEKEQLRKEKDDFRATRKSESRPLSPPWDQPAVQKPTHHERHSSTSSTTSNGSTHISSRHKSHSYKQPVTPSSDSLLHIAPVVQPSHFKGWQPLPPTQGLLTWQPEMPPRHIERLQKVRGGRQPRVKQNQQCVQTHVTSIHKESVQEPQRQTEPSVEKPVQAFVAQVGLGGSQTALDCNQGSMGKPPDIPQQPAASYNSDIWASTPSSYYTLFSTSGHTLFGNSTILSPSWDRVEDWPNV